MGLYKTPYCFDIATGQWLSRVPEGFIKDAPDPPVFSVSETVLSENWPSYKNNLEKIKRLIEDGDVYQINYTIRSAFKFRGDPLSFYRYLRDRQRVSYSGIWRRGNLSVLSMSPELFVKIQDGAVEVRPMKGTMRRGKDALEDLELKNTLREDTKNRAENLMIVDLLRNDLGSISRVGSVRVPSLFDIETYETLFQMTSTVCAEIDPNKGLYDIFSSLFPSGSVTGAPKIRAMEIIRDLEGYPRGVYTGAIGFITPERRSAVFNVAIRTVVLDGESGSLGLGGGIVYDSNPESEWKEALLKGAFLFESLNSIGPAKNAFSLIETMLWMPLEGFFLLDFHLDRLCCSAEFFAFKYDRAYIVKILQGMVSEKFKGLSSPQRVRLLFSCDGAIHLSFTAVDETLYLQTPSSNTVDSNNLAACVISDKTILSANPFIYHKTTIRDFYNQEYERYRGYDYAGLQFMDVIFMNEEGQITEGSRTNVVILMDGKFYTPPIRSGLLNGTYRRYILEQGIIEEKIIYPSSLLEASAVYLCNSVRGMRQVRFYQKAP
ncbi:para-aminobenzoate synthase, subunit I [Candidatus Omnitrophus magneticus]|uniref:Para-aminobenzoate synthase, subunit I n=1 Tax=Candidatus Omnitrophus magneticus TaxID=1609969 RepID=A0A0F0CJ81_9BACT|nr:para-aminobenzoate synthase, subunit I [Candidatus Omnitrophus magneticus]